MLVTHSTFFPLIACSYKYILLAHICFINFNKNCISVGRYAHIECPIISQTKLPLVKDTYEQKLMYAPRASCELCLQPIKECHFG